jgi:hypothetical protein
VNRFADSPAGFSLVRGVFVAIATTWPIDADTGPASAAPVMFGSAPSLVG